MNIYRRRLPNVERFIFSFIFGKIIPQLCSTLRQGFPWKDIKGLITRTVQTGTTIPGNTGPLHFDEPHQHHMCSMGFLISAGLYKSSLMLLTSEIAGI